MCLMRRWWDLSSLLKASLRCAPPSKLTVRTARGRAVAAAAAAAAGAPTASVPLTSAPLAWLVSPTVKAALPPSSILDSILAEMPEREEGGAETFIKCAVQGAGCTAEGSM
mmetsp:Transcript_29821/g.59882  ORF Transcript_29821/g.59882 Transcript_29821/m.59882 type:complete len:111 (+) Transcript_29821:447-779(+)